MIDEQTKQLIIDTARIDDVVLDTGMCGRILRDKHQPFILLGWCDESDGKKGHYWVVDGLAQQMKKQYGYTLRSPFSERVPYEAEVAIKSFVHCTWGWYGYKNGWFSPYVINDNNEVAELRSSHPNGEYYNISTFHIWK